MAQEGQFWQSTSRCRGRTAAVPHGRGRRPRKRPLTVAEFTPAESQPEVPQGTQTKVSVGHLEPGSPSAGSAQRVLQRRAPPAFPRGVPRCAAPGRRLPAGLAGATAGAPGNRPRESRGHKNENPHAGRSQFPHSWVSWAS